MAEGIEIRDLEVTVLIEVTANRGDSASPSWKQFYFVSAGKASNFASSNECLGDQKPVKFLHDKRAGTYYRQPPL